VNAPYFPDVWQARAVTALRNGLDVVVHAPTGAGKTFVFELLYASLKGQAVFTVPTRALANDKLAEWRALGWDVGISTGDTTERPNARVVVATLETQKGRFLRREGPRLLVVDEYQMLADAQRGADYELALALSPPETQLLLLSGSVANPDAVAGWLRRLGRNVEVVATTERPVPLEEANLDHLPAAPFERQIKSYWARYVARALSANLGPVLLFAPRRQASEELAREIASALPVDEPLVLSAEQAQLAGEALAKSLRRRVAYHHSGLSYAARAGLIEPLAKAGQLRAVVATNGLAAGVNFSLRSVLITDTRYTAGQI
jgi:replicative superfamily II helicase